MTMQITIACSRNPITDALAEPGFGGPDLDINYVAMPVMELFARAASDDQLDVVEFSLANHIMAVAQGTSRYVGLPVFSFRGFRHSMLWVRNDSTIVRPEQLKGKRIGIAAYALTALVYVRGLLSDDFGVRPTDVEWVRTGHERLTFETPSGVRITDAPVGSSLFDMLRTGVVDAIITFWSPNEKVDDARRLFADVIAVETEYYQRTGIYPIMHMFALTRRVYETNPQIVTNLLTVFEGAKMRWQANLARFGAESASTTPWSPIHLEMSQAILGPDLYPYGVQDNHRTLSVAIRFLCEQQLIKRLVSIEELFPNSGLVI
jgi:4,5-dihydroxyphthalate decarboxylase